MLKRIDRDELYMGIASLFAKRGTCKRNQVGCSLVKDGRVICSGYNGNLAGADHCNPNICDVTQPCTKAIHAEANAIAFAAKKGISLQSSTIYCTFSPCLKCAELIIQAGISEVVYLEEYRDVAPLALLDNHKIHVRKIN